jgi:hypothetical protein
MKRYHYLIKHHPMTTYWKDGGGIAPCINRGTRWRWAVSLTARPLYRRGKSPWYPMKRRLSGLQSRSWRGGEEKRSHYRPRWEFNSGRPARSLVTDWAFTDLSGTIQRMLLLLLLLLLLRATKRMDPFSHLPIQVSESYWESWLGPLHGEPVYFKALISKQQYKRMGKERETHEEQELMLLPVVQAG